MDAVVSAVADEILRSLKDTDRGHCLRVDYLDRVEAREICRVVRQNASESGVELDIFLLESQLAPDDLTISTDRAIELRNRKRRPLCLLVPNDLVDSAASSLTNSFANFDGRDLHRIVLRRFVEDLPVEARDACARVLVQLARLSMVSDDWKLDFVNEAKRLADGGQSRELGRELWRVGLIADAGADFVDRLDRNRRAVEALVKPLKATVAPTDRLLTLELDSGTIANLRKFFHPREMQAVRAWSKALLDGAGPTFDAWTTVTDESKDMTAFFVRSFLDKDGNVERYCKLSQPDAVGGALFGTIAPRSAVVVRWVTEPAAPANVHRWRAEIVQSFDDGELAFELPSTEVAASKRSARIRLDIQSEDEFDFGVKVRLVPLDRAGGEIVLPEGSEIVDHSDEFFLSTNVTTTAASPHETRKESPSIAFGRLEAAVSAGTSELVESQPLWVRRDLDYFTVRLNERRLLSVGTSRFLRETQDLVLATPRSGGRFVLDASQLAPVSTADTRSLPLPAYESDKWQAFLRSRESFFGRLRKSKPRDTVESADWSPELAGYALRYAQAYVDLATATHDRAELTDVLSVDTVLIRIGERTSDVREEALLILPTHPARAAWMAGYTQLLSLWEKQLLGLGKAREGTVDLLSLRAFAPSNTPAFAFHPQSNQVFGFFENIRFSTGLALPADVPDPYRRLSDVCALLSVGEGKAVVADARPARITRHLERYGALHPNASTINAVLVNPDQGELFAQAMSQYLSSRRLMDDAPPTPRLEVTAYVNDVRKSAMTGLERLRELRAEDSSPEPGDALHPGLATTVKSWSALAERVPDAHVAIVSDFTSPSIRAEELGSVPAPTSIGLFGLVARSVGLSEKDLAGHKWKYRITPDSSGSHITHPSGPRYSDTLIAVHAAILQATGRKLAPADSTNQMEPIIEVTLSAAEERILEELHRSADWVITLDRYFGMDYYDSPYTPHLSAPAQKYLIDYSPELADGQGHRVIVTTAWRDELEIVLGRALRELHFDAIDQSVGRLLHYLKTVSGRLALEAMGSSTLAIAAASLGVVTAWLQAQGRLRQAVLIPVDLHPRLFSRRSDGGQSDGERRCDLALVSLRRGIVETAFIEVKWRRGNAPMESLTTDIVMQTTASAEMMRQRFFSEDRVDGAYQRAHLASVLTFYLERGRRYELFDEAAVPAYLEHITRLEKSGLQFRPTYEGYIVSLADQPRKPIVMDEARITVLTARDFESTDGFRAEPLPPPAAQEVAEIPAAFSPEELRPVVGPDRGGEDDESPKGASGADPPTQDVAQAPADAQARLRRDGTQVSGQPGEIDIPLGNAPGGLVSWVPSVRGSPHAFISGIPGQGKSWTLLRMVRDLARHDVPSLVMDFHGQFVEGIPNGSFGSSSSVLDVSAGLPFSPFECASEPGPTDWRGNAYALAEIFGYVVGLGEMQRDVVYTSVRDAYRAAGFQEDGRAGDAYPTLPDVLHRIEATERARRVANVSARCRPLLELNLFDPVGQADSFLQSLRLGLVVDLSKLYLETLQVAACAFVLRKTYREMLRWGQADKLRLAVVVDEGHRLARDTTLPKLMKEGRKFGVAVVVASQGLADFHAEVLGNAGTKIVFRSNFPESRRAAGFLRARTGLDLAAAIEQLRVGAAYVQTPEMPLASPVEMLPLDA